jgi:hypothetical protein
MWESKTNNATTLTMTSGGNLTLSNSAGSIVWQTGTNVPGSILVLTKNYLLLVTSADRTKTFWASDCSRLQNGPYPTNCLQNKWTAAGCTNTFDPTKLTTKIASWNAMSSDSVINDMTLAKNSSDIELIRQCYGQTDSIQPGEPLMAGRPLANNGYTALLQTDGNLVIKDSAGTVVWQTNSAGSGAVKVSVDSDNNIILLDANNTKVWPAATTASFVKKLFAVSPANPKAKLINGILQVFDPNGNVINVSNCDLLKGNYPNACLSKFARAVGCTNTTFDPTKLSTKIVSWNTMSSSEIVKDFGSLQGSTNYTNRYICHGNNIYTVYQFDTLYSGDTLNPGQAIYNGTYRAVMQGDGNFVIYNGTSAIWGIFGDPGIGMGFSIFPGSVAKMQSDGNFVIYKSDLTTVVFQTNTSGSPGATLYLTNTGVLQVKSVIGNVLWASDCSVTTSPYIKYCLNKWWTTTGCNNPLNDTFINARTWNGLTNQQVKDNMGVWATTQTDDAALACYNQTAKQKYFYYRMDPGDILTVGNAIYSKNKQYYVKVFTSLLSVSQVNTSGGSDTEIWSYGNIFMPGNYAKLVMNPNGNLVLYNASNGASWQTFTSSANAVMVVTDSGAFTIVDTNGNVIWINDADRVSSPYPDISLNKWWTAAGCVTTPIPATFLSANRARWNTMTVQQVKDDMKTIAATQTDTAAMACYNMPSLAKYGQPISTFPSNTSTKFTIKNTGTGKCYVSGQYKIPAACSLTDTTQQMYFSSGALRGYNSGNTLTYQGTGSQAVEVNGYMPQNQTVVYNSNTQQIGLQDINNPYNPPIACLKDNGSSYIYTACNSTDNTQKFTFTQVQ